MQLHAEKIHDSNYFDSKIHHTVHLDHTQEQGIIPMKQDRDLPQEVEFFRETDIFRQEKN